MKRRFEIYTYWTLDADLASTFSKLEEYRSGNGYNVELESEETGKISIYPVKEEDENCLAIDSEKPGIFLERVIGRVSIEMAKHSEVHLHVVDRTI